MACTYAPDKPDECLAALRALVCPSRQRTNRIPRIVYARDSTMKRLFAKGKLFQSQQDQPYQVIEQSGSLNCTKGQSEN